MVLDVHMVLYVTDPEFLQKKKKKKKKIAQKTGKMGQNEGYWFGL